MSRPLVFLDTETTSLAADREVWEVAWVREHDGAITEGDASCRRSPCTGTRAFIGDVDLSTADPAALAVGRFYERHPGAYNDARPDVSRASDRETVADLHRATIGATIVGACPWFDTHAIERLMRRHGLCPQWHHRLICVESLVAGSLGRLVGGLAACMTELGLVWEGKPHTALGDALAARAIYHHLMGSAS